MTPKQNKLLRNVLAGKSITDSARLAGYSDNGCVGQIGSQALDGIKLKMPDVMNAHGLTDEALIEQYLKPLLSAEDKEFAKFEGKITDSVNVVAWAPRSTALDMAFKLKGIYAPKDAGSSAGAITVNVLMMNDPSDKE